MNANPQALPIPVPFCNTTLLLVDHAGEPFVPMKPVVEGMGLTWQPQHEKLRNSRFATGVTEIVIPPLSVRTDIDTSFPGAAEGAATPQRMTCLPLRKLPSWLLALHPNKVRPEIRDTVVAFQNECDDVLWTYWNSKHAPQDNQILRQTLAEVFQAIAALKTEVTELRTLHDPRVAAVTHKSVRQLLDWAKVPSHGRHPLNRKFSYHLPRHAITTGVLPMTCPHSGVLLYPVDCASQFMKERGNAWIADHLAKINGQGVLNFEVEKRKREPVVSLTEESRP